jgi:hypothetical protein
VKHKSHPELCHAEQRIYAIGDDCMADEFPMFRRRLTFPLSLLALALVVAAYLIECLAPVQFVAIKAVLAISGYFVFFITLVLRLWPRMWQ